jgi:putative ABC transport system permease protein
MFNAIFFLCCVLPAVDPIAIQWSVILISFAEMLVQQLWESIRFAIGALRSNRLRTLLSLSGITIGIFSIIFVLSVVDSMESDMKSSFEMIGSDVMFVQKWPMGPEEGAEDYEWWKYMRRRPPSIKDMERLAQRLPEAGSVSFSCGTSATAEFGNNFVEDARVMAVTYHFREAIALNIAQGRYFTEPEVEGGRNVAVIGALMAESLFAGVNPLDKEITIGGLKVQIIGIFEKEGTSLFGAGFDNAVMIPYAFGVRLTGSEVDDASIAVKGREGMTNVELKNAVISAMRSIRGVRLKDSNDFSILESTMINSMVDSIIGVFNVIGLVIGVFAILVGAFSIANIMFVSVSERTNIIGIQKALGAKNFFILNQFLFESMALCLIGGLAGLSFVAGLVALLNQLIDFHFILPIERIVLGISISLVVGAVAGIVPALKASKLNPVDAIRSK